MSLFRRFFKGSSDEESPPEALPPEEGTVRAPPDQAPEDALADALTPDAGAAEADVPAVWQPGDVILDLYEVKQVHEGGAMGLVYRVRHRTWNVDMAVKSPRPEYFQTDTHKENFEREAETWVSLDLHPNIVSCHYVRRLGGIPRIFAEYVEGGSLSDWIREKKLYEGGPQQALQRILDISIQMAWGLHFAHEQVLVHQDVKPANVIMTSDGVAKMTDFGLAKARAVAGEAGTPPGGGSILVSWGGRTPAYASPEQEAGKKLSRRTDIWSWAVSVLEMFTGEVTWGAGPAASEALKEYLGRQPEGDLPAMPEGLVALLRRCFAWEPEGRPTDMEKISSVLHEVHQEATGEPYPREAPQAVKLLADGLNNRALSMLDLGKVEEAERLWEEALKADPQHLHATYNRGLHLWRTGRMRDDELVAQMKTAYAIRQGDWEAAYLLGLVHLDGGNADAAVPLLVEASRAAAIPQNVGSALKAARKARKQKPPGGYLRRLKGHRKMIRSVAVTADGRFALSGSNDKTLRLWQLATGRCLRTLEGHTDQVWAVALRADGRFALSGGYEKTLRLWDLATGRCLRTLEGHEGGVTAVALTPDGRFALSGSSGHTLRLWDLATGRCLRTLEGHTNAVESVALTPDGRFALSGSWDRTLRLWELATGQCLRTLRGHTGIVRSVALATDGRFALSGSDDTTLRLWELATGQCLRTLESHTEWVASVAMTRDGRLAVSGSGDRTVRLWELATGRCLCILKTHWAYAVATADGRFAVTAGLDGILYVWDLRARQQWYSGWSYTRPRPVPALAQEVVLVRETLAKAGALLARGELSPAAAELRAARSAAGYERHPDLLERWHQAGRAGRRSGLLGAWHMRTFEGHTREVTSVALTADGRSALSGSDDETLRLWELSTGRCLLVLEGHTDMVGSVALTADRRFALSGSEDKTLRLWELATGQCLRTLKGHTKVRSVAVTPDGRFVLSGSEDKTLRLWDLATGRCLRTLKGHRGKVHSVAVTADGRFALSGSDDWIPRLWDLASGRFLRILKRHLGPVKSVAVTLDGRFALSASHDKALRLWESSTGECLCILHGHVDTVTSVAVTPDGRFALSGSSDKTLRLWDLATGSCLRTLEGHTGDVRSVALTADGRFAISGSNDNTLRLWELDWDYEFPDPADWDEGARPYLEIFLTLHTPYAAPLPEDREPSEEEILLAVTRRGRPSWTEEDFQALIRQLQHAGYGWLRPEGVRAELERMALDWDGPPPSLFDVSGYQETQP